MLLKCVRQLTRHMFWPKEWKLLKEILYLLFYSQPQVPNFLIQA